MSTTITLADGREATIASGLSADGRTTISYQFLSAAGAPLSDPALLAESDVHAFTTSPIVRTVDGADFVAAPLSDGGFELVYHTFNNDNEGFTSGSLFGIEVDADGHVGAAVFLAESSQLNRVPSTGNPHPEIAALAGDRFAVAFDSFDGDFGPTGHQVVLATAQGGTYANITLSSHPDAITHDVGDITLTWNAGGIAEREILGPNGQILADRAASQVFTLGVSQDADLEAADFNPAHDQIRLVNADGSPAGGAASTLTYDVRSHTLAWDPDSQGPAPATQVASFVDPKAASPDGQPFDVANLADGFRPAVLKVIAADGSQDITWFDTTNAQPWDTLHATEDPQGNVLTYGSASDNGTQQVFTFDVGNVQPWTRYVDELDVTGHVTERTVLYDDNTSWTAKYAYAGGQVVSYELDSFDAQGRQVGQSFFNADGTPLVGH